MLSKQFDIIEIFQDESRKPVVKEAVDFSSVSKLSCWVLININKTEIKIIGVYTKRFLAENQLRRNIEEKKYHDLRIISSTIYNDISINNHYIESIKLDKDIINSEFTNTINKLGVH